MRLLHVVAVVAADPAKTQLCPRVGAAPRQQKESSASDPRLRQRGVLGVFSSFCFSSSRGKTVGKGCLPPAVARYKVLLYMCISLIGVALASSCPISGLHVYYNCRH